MAQLLIISTILLLCFHQIHSAATDSDLFLTPLIKTGDLGKARALAEDSTKLIRSNLNVKSYSGYFTVDEKANSNLFFWFFPAQNNPENAPVILWINEIPGFSSLKGIFVDTGPFVINENNVLQGRNTSWTKTHSVLYIDSPVGTGFSFTDSTKGYAKNSEEEGNEVYEALIQFFTLFKEFQPRDFYLAGENYAVSFIPYIARHIHNSNVNSAVKINLKGFVVGSPIVSINSFLYRAQHLSNLGLIDEEQREIFHNALTKSVKLVDEGKVVEGSAIGWGTLTGPDSLLYKFTGFSDYRSALESKVKSEEDRFQQFIDKKEVHAYLHVGLHKFIDTNYEVFNTFLPEIVGNHAVVLQEMLDKGYRILLYTAQFDILVPEKSVVNDVMKLNWKGAENFSKAPRKMWKVNGDLAGYIKIADNLTYAMVRNAGNHAIRDQPEWTLDLVERFLYNKEF